MRLIWRLRIKCAVRSVDGAGLVALSIGCGGGAGADNRETGVGRHVVRYAVGGAGRDDGVVESWLVGCEECSAGRLLSCVMRSSMVGRSAGEDATRRTLALDV